MAYIDPKVACAPWITPDRLCCEGGGSRVECDGTTTPLQYEWTDTELIQAASDLLYARTCYRYPGVCTRTIWPCLCCCSCGNHPCGCGAYYAIELTSDYPILSVVSVEINGVVVNPALYRLDENIRIVRTDGERWPECNNLGITNPPSSADEVKVTYTTGRTIPTMLQIACAELVCELKKACNGDATCSLPTHVKSVTRRGVEININDVIALLLQGVTGNPVIDHALTVYGRCPKASMSDLTRIHRHVRVS